MNDLQDLSQWWEKESQQIRNEAIRKLGKRIIQMLEMYQEQMNELEQRSFQREQKLFSRIERCQQRLKTMEERVELLIEAEVEMQKIVFEKQVDKLMAAQKKVFMEAVDMMFQTFQDTLREQFLPKVGDTMPKA